MIVRFTLVILLISSISCNNERENDLEINFIENFLNDYKKENSKDSIILGLDNSNVEIFKTYERFLKSNKVSVENTVLKSEIFSEAEYENYKSQMVSESNWEIDLKKTENVYSQNELSSQKDILYVTKPVFTSNKNYVLIYSYTKHGKDNVYFIPAIEVYTKKNGKWEKVTKFKHFKFSEK